MTRATIRFNDQGGASWYWLKMSPMEDPSPSEREFRGGDQLEVIVVEREDKPEVVDLIFPDGIAAYEVPREFFSIIA